MSLALHGLGALLIWSAWQDAAPAAAPGRPPVQVAVALRQPDTQRVRVLIGPETPAPGQPPSAPRRTPARSGLPRRPVASPEPAPSAPAPLAPVEEAADPVARHGDGAEGVQAGGPGDTAGGSGEPGGVGSGSGGRRPLALSGRVVGGNRRALTGPQGMPYAPLAESTALRTYDVFPPLPVAQWTGRRPYLVVVDVCVGGDGRVSDVSLARPVSRVFDPVVLEAVRTWRYRPRLVDGHAQPFCHLVAIKYEQL